MSAPQICYVILFHRVPGDRMSSDVLARHLDFQARLNDAGKLMLCGQLLDHPSTMVVLKARDKEQATEIALADPLVREGGQRFEVRTWSLVPTQDEILAAGLTAKNEVASRFLGFV